jgi:hypothetical protein
MTYAGKGDAYAGKGDVVGPSPVRWLTDLEKMERPKDVERIAVLDRRRVVRLWSFRGTTFAFRCVSGINVAYDGKRRCVRR